MKLKDWGVKLLKDLNDGDRTINFSGYCILYSAKDHTHLLIFDNEVHLEPETFYFVPPNSALQFMGKSENALLIWFTADLFVDRIEFLKNIEDGIFLRKHLGFAMKNNFIPYDDILNHYYLPLLKGQVNNIFAKNLLINFLEFILIRALLEIDPKMEDLRKDSYEKEISNRFVLLLQQEGTYKFKMDYYANKLNISKRTLDNAIKATYGCTTKRFVISKALETAKKLLRGTGIPIKIISQDLGFSESSNFSIFFKKHTGSSPREYRNKSIGDVSNFEPATDL